MVVGGVSGASSADGEDKKVRRVEISMMGLVATLIASRGSAIARLEGGGVCGDAGKNSDDVRHRIRLHGGQVREGVGGFK
jgi:hypothetical protein